MNTSLSLESTCLMVVSERLNSIIVAEIIGESDEKKNYYHYSHFYHNISN